MKHPMKVKLENSLILNPFQRIAGWTALLIGLIIMLLAGLIAGFNGAHFPDLVTVLFTISTGRYVPVVELLFGWGLLSISSIIVFWFFRIQKFRVIDILGSIALSRAPFILIATLNSIVQYSSFNQLVVLPLLLVLVGWSFVWMYHALKVSGNLKGTDSWFIFILVGVLSETMFLLTISKIYLLIL